MRAALTSAGSHFGRAGGPITRRGVTVYAASQGTPPSGTQYSPRRTPLVLSPETFGHGTLRPWGKPRLMGPVPGGWAEDRELEPGGQAREQVEARARSLQRQPDDLTADPLAQLERAGHRPLLAGHHPAGRGPVLGGVTRVTWRDRISLPGRDGSMGGPRRAAPCTMSQY